MRHNDSVTARRASAFLALALAFWVVALGTKWALSGDDLPPAHGPHVLASTHLSELAVAVDHPHLQDGSTPSAPDTFAEAVLPRATTTLVALGLIVAIVTVASLWRQAGLTAARGPPRSLDRLLTGRALLTRLCIARC